MYFLSARLWACIGTGWLLFSAPHLSRAQSAAQRADPAGTLTLAAAIRATLARNPDLTVNAFELKAADARTLQAGLRPNPEVSVELEDFGGTGVVRGVDTTQTTLSLSQVIELGNKRDRRVDAALAARRTIDVDNAARELDVLAEVTRRFIDVVADQEHLVFAQGAVKVADATVAAITIRVRAARTPEAELSRARIALTRARLQERVAQSALAGARASLAAMWGATEPRFGAANANLYDFPALLTFEGLRERLDRNPDLARFASQTRLRASELRLAQALSRPNLTLSAGFRRYEASNDVGFVAGFSVGLPVFDRNQGGIAEARVQREQTAAGEQATRVKLQAQLFQLFQQVTASREQVAILRQEALPLSQAALDQTQYGYDRGRFSYLELAAAQQDLLGLKIALIDAAADAQRLTTEIERLTGEALAADDNTRDVP